NNDIFGDGVNIAARLQPIAEPGGICIPQDVYNHIKNQLEFHTVSLGPHELKNISQKIEIYKVVMEVMGSRAVAHVTAPAAPKKGSAPAGHKQTPIAWILVGILLTVAGFFAWHYYQSGQQQTQTKV